MPHPQVINLTFVLYVFKHHPVMNSNAANVESHIKTLFFLTNPVIHLATTTADQLCCDRTTDCPLKCHFFVLWKSVQCDELFKG